MRFRIIVTVALVTGATLLLVTSSCGGGAESYAVTGREAYYAGQMSQALSHLKVAMRAGLGDDDPELRYIYAVTLLKHRRPQQALDLLATLVDHPQYRTRAINRISETLISSGQIPEAQKRLTRALESSPDDSTLLEALGNVRMAMYEASWDKMRELLERHLGARMGKWHRDRFDVVVACAQEKLEEIFEERYLPLGRAGFTDRTTLLELIDATRTELGRALDVYNRVCDLNPAAFGPRLFIGKMFALAERFPEAERRFQEVAFMDTELLLEPDQKKGLTVARFEAVRSYLSILREGKRFAEGIAFLLQVREKLEVPESLDGHLADFYYLDNRMEDLGVVVARILDFDARNAWGCFYRGYILYSQNKFKQSISYFERAQGVAPRSGTFNRFLALALKESGDNYRALQALERAMDAGERDAETVIARAELIDLAGDPAGARRFMGVEAYKLQDQPAEQKKIYDAYDKMLQRDGYAITNLASARKAFQEDPRDLLLALRLAEFERQAGNYGRARSFVRRVTAKAGHLPEAWLIEARIETSAGRWPKVQESLEKYLEQRPASAETAWLEAQAHLGLKDFEEAREAADRCLSIDAKYVHAARTLVAILIAQKNYEAAEREANTRLAAFPDDEPLLQDLIKALSGQGKPEEAAKALKRLHALQPENPWVAQRLGNMLLSAGKHEESVTYLCMASQLAPKNAKLTLQVARALVRAQAWKQAAPLLQRIVPKMRKGPARTQSYLDLMEVYHRLQDYMGVLDVALELRRTGAEEQALNKFVQLAVEIGAWYEAAAAFQVALDGFMVDRNAAVPGLEALIRIGSHQKARAAMDDLSNRRVIRRDAVVNLRMQALVGSGQTMEASKLLRDANSRSSPSQRASLWTAWFRALRSRRDAASIIKDLDWALSQAPRAMPVLMVGVWACVQKKDLAKALTISKRAFQLDPEVAEVQAMHAAVLLANGHFQEAIGIAPDKTSIGAVINGLGGLRPRPRTFGRYLHELKQGRFQAAQNAAPVISDLPRTFRGPLKRLAARLSGSNAGAAIVATALGHAYVYRAAGLLQLRADAELRAAAEQQGSAAGFLEHYRAWVRVSMGAATVAVGIVQSEMDAGVGKQKPMLAYVACLTVLNKWGPAKLVPYVDLAVGKGALAPDLAFDLALACREKGADKQAYLILRRGGETGPQEIALAAEIAHASGNRKEAAQLAARLPEHLRSRMPHAFILIRGALEEAGTMAAARSGLKRLLRNKRMRKDVHGLLLLDAVAEAGMNKEFDEIVAQLLIDHPYDAYVLHHLLGATSRFGRPRGLAERLRPVFTFLDPAGNLRITPRERRKRAQQ